MKKGLVVLLFLVGAAGAVQAQGGDGRNYSGNQSRDVILGQQGRTVYGNDRRDDVYSRKNGYISAREREEMIQQIRRNYQWRIQEVKRDRYMRSAQKKRQIRALESERDMRIREVWQRYERNNTAYNSRDRRRY